MKINEYLCIGDAARYLGFTENTLRNWEMKGLISPHRNPMNNYRLYRLDDIRNLYKELYGNYPEEKE